MQECLLLLLIRSIYVLHTYCFNFELQMLMNVLKTLMGVILMQLAAILMEITPALATLDSGVMDRLAQVCMWVLHKQKGWDRGKLFCMCSQSFTG